MFNDLSDTLIDANNIFIGTTGYINHLGESNVFVGDSLMYSRLVSNDMIRTNLHQE